MDRQKRIAIRGALAAIAAADGGRLIAARVVDAAANPASSLHDQFEWDDTAAAREHRMSQARTLIRSVRVVVETDEKTLSVVYYIRDPAADAHAQGYVPTLSLRSDTGLARDALVAEVTRAVAAMKRAKDVASVLGLADEIDEIVRDLDAFRAHAVRQEAA